MLHRLCLLLFLIVLATGCGASLTVDQFEMRTAVVGDRLTLSLMTDLPVDSLVTVGMGHVFLTPNYKYTKERPTNLYLRTFSVADLEEGIEIDLAYENRDFYDLVQQRSSHPLNADWGRVVITPQHYVYMMFRPTDDIDLQGIAVSIAGKTMDGEPIRRVRTRAEFNWGGTVVIRP